jgi:hypothetical protein
LKEIVVVVGEAKYYFKGEDIKANNTAANVLIIMDGNKDIAVFQKWDLWRELEKD